MDARPSFQRLQRTLKALWSRRTDEEPCWEGKIKVEGPKRTFVVFLPLKTLCVWLSATVLSFCGKRNICILSGGTQDLRGLPLPLFTLLAMATHQGHEGTGLSCWRWISIETHNRSSPTKNYKSLLTRAGVVETRSFSDFKQMFIILTRSSASVVWVWWFRTFSSSGWV